MSLTEDSLDEGDDSVGRGSSEARRLARGGSFSLVSQVANAFLGSTFLVLVSHFLPQDQAGGLLEAVALFSTAAVVATCGADIGLMRMMPEYRRRGPGATVRLLTVAAIPTAIVGCALAVGLFLSAHPLAAVLVHKSALRRHVVTEVRLLVPAIPFAGVTTSVLAASRAWSVVPSMAVQYLLTPLLRPALFGVFVIFGLTTLEATVAWEAPVLVAAGAMLGVAWFMVRQADKEAVDTLDDDGVGVRWPARQFWSFAGPRLLESTLLVFLWGFDVALVGAMISAGVAASYAVATRYVAMTLLAQQALLVAIPTRISDLMRTGSRDEVRALYRVATWWSMSVAWPAAFALALFSPFFLGLFGRGYRVGDTALAVLAGGAIIGSSTGPSGAVLLMAGRTSVNLGITAAAVGTNIPLMFLLAPRFGIIGAAIASLSSICVLNVLLGALLWRNFRMSPYGRAFAYVASSTTVCFGAVGALIRGLMGVGPVAFGTYALVAMGLYSVFVFRGRRLLGLGAFRSMLTVRPGSRYVPQHRRHSGGSVPRPMDAVSALRSR